MKRFLTAVALLACSSIAFAGCTTKACTGKVSKLYVNASKIYVKMNQDMTKLNCSLVSGAYATLKADHPHKEEIYSLLLAGHTSKNSNIGIRISEGSSECSISYATSTL